jgi:hypothetical protein
VGGGNEISRVFVGSVQWRVQVRASVLVDVPATHVPLTFRPSAHRFNDQLLLAAPGWEVGGQRVREVQHPVKPKRLDGLPVARSFAIGDFDEGSNACRGRDGGAEELAAAQVMKGLQATGADT